jgi:hypothetical protein
MREFGGWVRRWAERSHDVPQFPTTGTIQIANNSLKRGLVVSVTLLLTAGKV